MYLGRESILGAVHKVRHAILGQFYPPPPSHFVTHPGIPKNVRHTSRTPRFLVGLVQKRGQKPPVQILSQLFAGFLSGAGVLSGGLLSGRFFPGWFLSVPPSVRIHLLQQKVKHHFKFPVSYVR